MRSVGSKYSGEMILINERVVCSLMTGIVFHVVLVVLIRVLCLCPFIKNSFNFQFLLICKKKIVPIVHNTANIIQRRDG